MFEKVGEFFEKHQIKEKIVDGIEKTLDFVQENEEAILVTVPIVMTLGTLVHNANVDYKMAQDRKRTTYTIWDPRHMHAWDLRRQLTNRERRELDRRVKNGENMADVLEDMRVLR